jgi:predicted KAP-like P-loop ATPase
LKKATKLSSQPAQYIKKPTKTIKKKRSQFWVKKMKKTCKKKKTKANKKTRWES